MLLRKGEYKMPVGKQTAPAGGTIGFCLERWAVVMLWALALMFSRPEFYIPIAHGTLKVQLTPLRNALLCFQYRRG